MLAFLLIVVTLLLMLITAILFTPMVLVIRSVKDLYKVQWGPVHAQVWFTEEDPRFRLRAPFWSREGTLHELSSPAPDPPKAPFRDKHGSGKPKRSPRSRWRPSPLAILRTFRVRRFHWSWDTGDVLWNAWLFPLFHAARLRGRDVAISFTGRNEIELVLDNNLYRILTAVLLHSSTINMKKP